MVKENFTHHQNQFHNLLKIRADLEYRFPTDKKYLQFAAQMISKRRKWLLLDEEFLIL